MICAAVIPARRAEKTILRTLESLRLGNGDVVGRVFVVTSRDDPTADVVRRWSERDSRVELVIAESALTAGAARNMGRAAVAASTAREADAASTACEAVDGCTGAAAARDADLLLFLDADCSLEPGGAARLARERDERGADAIGARILGEGGLVARVRHVLEFKEAASRREPPAGWLVPSTTLACTASAFDRTGGFPDLWPGEDLVFVSRLRELGGVAVRSASVCSTHHHPAGVFEMLRHQQRLGRTAAEARRMAPMRGEAFARSRLLATLLFPGRLARIATWEIGEGAAAALRALALSPWIVAGLAAWTWGFVSASGPAVHSKRAGVAAWTPVGGIRTESAA